MDVLLVAVNAKYIHTNNAIRLLKANSIFDCEIIDFTIHDDLDKMADTIVNLNPKIIGFSCYIWNINLIQNLILNLKSKVDIPIILGGPEVSYDAKYFLKKLPVQVIIKGEGELVFDEVVRNLLNGNKPTSNYSVSYWDDLKLIDKPIGMIKDLKRLKSPYYFKDDLMHIPKRIAYIESSRGCPYKCSYCLSSLEKGVRFFDPLTVQKDIKYLLDHGAKTFKFLDRTFNASKHMIEVLKFIIDNALENTVFQFEITGDILDERILDYIHENGRKGLFRFEIGIQSTNETTNLLVDRIQNNDKLFHIIKTIQSHDMIDLHLDLIAGLPKEDLNRFKTTFNTVYLLNAKELQLGFLKMLRGTKIRREASLYGYHFDENAPYEITKHDDLSSDDINKIKTVEEALNLYHNKGFFRDIIFKLASQYNPFDFFYDLSMFTKKHRFDFHRYQLHELYMMLEMFIKAHHFEMSFIDDLRLNYLKRAKVKPQIYFDIVKDKGMKKTIFDPLMTKHKLSMNELFKHSVIYQSLDKYHVIYYHNHQAIEL
ncbi:MAG: DUF4080 domain-containing protein [Candidatus Izemoplasmataceae bacterium]